MNTGERVGSEGGGVEAWRRGEGVVWCVCVYVGGNGSDSIPIMIRGGRHQWLRLVGLVRECMPF